MTKSETALLETLTAITGTGQFHSTGHHPYLLLGLNVTGLGEIAFPLHPVLAKELKKLAEAAPYGKGEDTILDESVRKCWQIDASQFQLASTAWKHYLKKITATVATDLGITEEVIADPYKLLLYEKGGHFLPHRDTEKVGQMFGTLIIALPSDHEGGQLLIRHDDQEITIDFSQPGTPDDPHPLRHAAFFADCEHEVLPVTSGYRCCLVYNLRLEKGDPSQLNLPLTEQSRKLMPHLQKLKNNLGAAFTAIPLEHRYTQANLSLRQLKNNDRARGHALLTAAQEAGLTSHLALLTFHQMGELEGDYEYYSRGRQSHRQNTEETMGEVYEENLTLDHWRTPNDHPLSLGCWNIHIDHILSQEEIGSGDPHEKEAEGYTGNAGCTMDHWYHHAVIVLWHPDHEESLLTQYNLNGACQKLLALSKNKTRPIRLPILAKAVIDALEKRSQRYVEYSGWRDDETFQTILQAIANLKDPDLLKRLFTALPAQTLQACDTKHWKLLIKAFSPATFLPLFQNIPDDQLEDTRDTLFSFLESLLAKNKTEEAAQIAPLLLRLQPAGPARRSSFTEHWKSESPTSSAPGNTHESHILLAASHLLQKTTDRKKASTFLHGGALDKSTTLTHLRDTLARALLKKTLAKHFNKENSLYPELLHFALSTLEEEIARPLPPYPDLTRPCPQLQSKSYNRRYSYTKKGDPIQELQKFMASPTEETHDFKYAQEIRDDLTNLIREHRLDLTHTTHKNGTPHTLRCTKNDHSHQRDLKRRKDDQALLKKLQNL